MNKAPLRQFLGSFKQKLVDEWPYCYSQMKARKIATTAREFQNQLPKLVCDDKGPFEIHMLCGERQVDMGIWASWSLLRFLNPSQLWLHSDGTITKNSMQKWQALIAGVQFVEPTVGDSAWNKSEMGSCPNLNELRRSCYCARKLTDFHLFGSNAKILMMDSDVLCFKRPEEVSRLFLSEEKVIAFNAGRSGTAYMADEKEIGRILNVTLPDRFNAGFMLVSRFEKADFLLLEDCMKRLRMCGIHNWSHCWAEQTLYGIAAAVSGISKPLPETYHLGRGTKHKTTIARHYVGIPSIRPRFYIEGLHEILNSCFKTYN